MHVYSYININSTNLKEYDREDRVESRYDGVIWPFSVLTLR